MSGKEKLQTFVGWKRTVDVCLTYQIAFSYEVVTERSWQFLVSQCTNRKKRAELPISVEQSTARHGHSGGHKELSWIWVSPVSILKEHVETMTNSSKPKKGLPNGLVRRSLGPSWVWGSGVPICSIAEQTLPMQGPNQTKRNLCWGFLQK